MTKTKESTIIELYSIFLTFEDGNQVIIDADPNIEKAMQVKRHRKCTKLLSGDREREEGIDNANLPFTIFP